MINGTSTCAPTCAGRTGSRCANNRAAPLSSEPRQKHSTLKKCVANMAKLTKLAMLNIEESQVTDLNPRSFAADFPNHQPVIPCPLRSKERKRTTTDRERVSSDQRLASRAFPNHSGIPSPR